jgi:hypothetical protein
MSLSSFSPFTPYLDIPSQLIDAANAVCSFSVFGPPLLHPLQISLILLFRLVTPD